MSIVSPTWIEVPASRQSGWKGVLGSLEDRMPSSHIYRNVDDVDNWAHETTHGLNSQLRNKLNPRGNSVFVPDRWACSADDPPGISLSDVAKAVPKTWRGMSYDLYMRKQTQWWDDTPTYVLDEWTAYANGLHASVETGKDAQASSVMQMTEFMGYAWALLTLEPNKDSNLAKFVLWFSVRTVKMLKYASGKADLSGAERHLTLLRTSDDGSRVRDFLVGLGGDEWRRAVIG